MGNSLNIALAILDSALAAFGMVAISRDKSNSVPFFVVAVIFESALILSAAALLRGVVG